nr:aspartate aminotransferase family protein [Candidatus Sigynarchaeota archaeon]
MARKRKTITIPDHGISRDVVLKEMESIRDSDAKWKDGKTFAYVYYAGEEHYEFLKKAHNLFFSENALSPMTFPSLKKFEAEVISMTADILGGDRKVFGNITTGGTESLLMAVKTYRDWAREKKPEIKEPEIVLPISAHPSFEKAAHYFGLVTKKVPWTSEYRCDVDAMKRAITENTIMLVGSAPEYPRGMIDPIKALGELAIEHDIGLHVDSCLGGFMLPFLKKLGYPIPDFDFSVPGVTSMSADLHKYGFAAKGASAVLYANEKLWKYQFFSTEDWPGGIYASPTMTGTRPGSSIAAAWATLKAMGEDGYMKYSKMAMDTAQQLQKGINKIPGFHVLGKPDMAVFSFTSEKINIYALGESMEKRGWVLDKLQDPPALHMIVNPLQGQIIDQFISDLRACVDHEKEHPTALTEGMAALYGALATIPKKDAKDTVLGVIADQYKV